MTKRRRFTDDFKAKVALEALRGDQTLSQIASRHKLHPTQISQWKLQVLEGLSGVFAGGKRGAQPSDMDTKIKDLHAKIGELTVERDFLSRGLGRCAWLSARLCLSPTILLYPSVASARYYPLAARRLITD